MLCLPIEGILFLLFTCSNIIAHSTKITEVVYKLVTGAQDRPSLFLIQQRAPCIAGYRKVFAQQLISLLLELKSSLTILLSGATTEDVEFNLRLQNLVP